MPVTRQDAFEAPPLRPLRYLSVERFTLKRTLDYTARAVAEQVAPRPLLLASAVSGGLTLIGVVYLVLRSRTHALRWFKRSILVTIFLTDLFTFYYQQLGAVADLAVDLILLAVFEALLEVEHRRTGRVEEA